MKSYEFYTVDDFLDDTDFRDWVQGHSERESFWLSFLDHYPQQRGAFQQAEQFIRAVNVAPESLSENDIRQEVERFLSRSVTYKKDRYPITALVHPHHREPVLFPRWNRLSKPVLILFALAVVGGYWFFREPIQKQRTVASEKSVDQLLVETNNPTQHLLRVVLTDGSEVMLSPKSQLRYPARFTQNARIVYLNGEAVFSVKRSVQPFMVYSGNLITKVLGTRFVVRAFEGDRKSTVQVLSGKVSVYDRKTEQSARGQKEMKGLILTANQAAIFGQTDGDLTKTLVSNPTPVKPETTRPSFVYDETPLPTILREIEQAYGIPIQFDSQRFEESRITAVLTNESLYEKLNLLCKAASATYEITDGQIVISPKSTYLPQSR